MTPARRRPAVKCVLGLTEGGGARERMGCVAFAVRRTVFSLSVIEICGSILRQAVSAPGSASLTWIFTLSDANGLVRRTYRNGDRCVLPCREHASRPAKLRKAALAQPMRSFLCKMQAEKA